MKITNKALKKLIQHEKEQNKIASIKSRNAQLSYKRSQDEFDARYKLMMCSSNKMMEICGYIVHNIDPMTNIFRFTISGLAKKFHCSRNTVQKTLKILKSDTKHTIVTNHYIRYRGLKPMKPLMDKIHKFEGEHND